MNSAEHRARCIEAIETVLLKRFGYGWPLLDVIATEIFDALHGIARVVPTEATPEMELAAIKAPIGRTWHDMSAAADLTNPPEGKP